MSSMTYISIYIDICILEIVSRGIGLFGFVVTGVLPTACAPHLIRTPLTPGDILMVLFLFGFFWLFLKPKMYFTPPVAQFL